MQNKYIFNYYIRLLIMNQDVDDLKGGINKILPLPTDYVSLFEQSKILLKTTPPTIFAIINISFYIIILKYFFNFFLLYLY